MKKQIRKQFLAFFLAIIVCISPLGTVDIPAAENTEISDHAEVTGDGSMGQLIANEVSGADQTKKSNDSNDIFELEISQKTAQVQLKTEKAATLIVAIYTDLNSTQMLASGKTTIEAGVTKATVLIETETMPEYFIAKAYLLEKTSFKPLCNPYVTQMYTESMQKLENSTTDDYKDREVLKLDEDDNKTNFGVFKEDTLVFKEESEKNQVIDNTDGTYTIMNADDDFKNLKEGDTFSYQQKEGKVILAKIKNISIQGNTIFITEDKNTDLTDYFDYFKLEIDSNDLADVNIDDSNLPGGMTVESEENVSSINMLGKNEVPKSAKLKINKLLTASVTVSAKNVIDDDCKLDGEINVGVGVDFKIYILPDYKYISFKVQLSLKTSLGISGNKDVEFPLPAIVLSYFKMINVKLTPELVGSVSGKVKGYIEEHGEWGIAYDSNVGFKTINTKLPVDINLLEVSGDFFIGLSMPTECFFVNETLGEAEIKPTAGIVAEVKSDNIVNYEIIHDCITCFSGELYWKADVNIKFSLVKDTTKFEITPITLKEKWKTFYWSVGHKKFGFGTCPYIKYAVEILVADAQNRRLENSEITVIDKETGKTIGFYISDGLSTSNEQSIMTNHNGLAEIYLPNGNYIIKAKKQKVIVQKEIAVSDGKKVVDLVLQMPIATPTSKPKPKPTVTIKPTSTPEITPTPTISELPEDNSNISWELKEDGILYIKGKGKIPSYELKYTGKYPQNVIYYSTAPWYKDREDIKKIIIEEGITTIGHMAFYGLDNMENVIFPKTLVTIEKMAFFECSSLNSVTFPENLEKIGELAFYGCKSLRELIIPDNVTTIDSCAFKNCSNIVTFKLPHGIKELIGSMFEGWKAIKNISIPESVTNIWDHTFHSCDNIEKLIIPKNVTSVGSWVFAESAKLKTVYFTGNKPSYIGDRFLDKVKEMTLYYPEGDSTWDGIESEKFGGKNIIWKAYIPGEINQNDEEENSDEIQSYDFTDDIDSQNEEETEELETPISDAEEDSNVEQMENEEEIEQMEIEGVDVEELEPSVVNDQKRENSVVNVKSYSKRKPGSYTLFVLLKNKNTTDILAADNLLYINQATADKTGFVSFSYQWNVMEINPVSCVFGDVIHQHTYGAWKTIKKATVFSAEIRQRKCSGCGKTEKKVGKKIKPILKVSASTVALKTKQSTKGLKVVKMAAGDSVVSWKSADSKIVKVSKTGQLFAQKKTGKTIVTVKLKSGLSKKITVKIQNKPVKTTKLTGLKKQIILKKNQKVALKPVKSPFTSLEKITYTSSNKKLVSVSAKGIIKGLKHGKAQITVKSGRKKYVINVNVK